MALTKIPSELSSTTGIVDNSNATAITIDSSENVGIGTSSPSNYYSTTLVVDAPAEDGITVVNPTTGTGYLMFADGTSGNARYRGYIAYSHSADVMQLATSGLERMRIDSSGNLLVGKTTLDGTGSRGLELRGDGLILASKAGQPMSLDRTGSDGVISGFYKDGSIVGSIGTSLNNGGRYSYISGLGATGVGFYSNGIYPSNGTGGFADNSKDVGSSSVRWDDIYATNGTIQTSDRNEKQDIAELSEAEQRVAVACKGLLRKFRWKDSVAEKGDDARIHFGIIAQDLQAAFEAEGLDAGDYAMFISTTWTDEETNEEKTRMGVRYSELLAFIISAI